MNKTKIAYYISTGLLSLMMVGGAGMYFFNHAEVAEVFTSLGYPTYIIYPLAIAKLLGLVAIWTRLSDTLKEFAYAGYMFDFTLAATAHLVVGDGGAGGPIVAFIFALTSYLTQKQLPPKGAETA